MLPLRNCAELWGLLLAGFDSPPVGGGGAEAIRDNYPWDLKSRLGRNASLLLLLFFFPSPKIKEGHTNASTAAGLSPVKSMDPEKLRQSLLEKREAQLRQKLLMVSLAGVFLR